MRPYPSRQRWIAVNGAGAAYADIRMTNPTPFPDIGAGYEPLDDIFDDELGTSEKILVGLAQGTFTFEFPGRYRVLLNGSMFHDNSNQGRTVNVRLQNLTDNATIAELPVGIGRNVRDTVLVVNYAVEIGETQIGKTIQFQIGGGDSVNDITFNVLQAGTHIVSGYPV